MGLLFFLPLFRLHWYIYVDTKFFTVNENLIVANATKIENDSIKDLIYESLVNGLVE